MYHYYIVELIYCMLKLRVNILLFLAILFLFDVLKIYFAYACRSIVVYGCFAAGLASLIIFAAISWFSGKVDSSNAEESTNQIALSHGIRITVYLLTAVLAVASSVISLIDVNQTVEYDIVPVRIFKNILLNKSKTKKCYHTD